MTQPKNAEHETAAPVGTMDLNNPPKEPYHYEAFPRVLYKAKDPRDDKTPVEYDNTTVQNEKELKDHLAKGWKMEPPEPVAEPKAPEHVGPKK